MTDRQPRPPFAAIAAFPLAALVASASVGGILLNSAYGRETASWAAQSIGQDWVHLLLVAPCLATFGTGAARGSRACRLVLGGVLAYTVYTFAIYAFAVHFNRLFLVYCVTLGLSFFSLASLAHDALAEDVSGWFDDRTPVRLAGGFLIGVGVVFAALWSAELVPAIVTGAVPASVVEGGVTTNPVHVLDLSVVLPVHMLAGVWLWRRRPAGYFLASVVLAFGVLMPITIGALVLVMRARGIAAGLALTAAMGVLALASATLLVRLLRGLVPPTSLARKGRVMTHGLRVPTAARSAVRDETGSAASR